ncbi:MAG: HPF/RaiA family ribosome-associated protein [Gammaproteobacteria bacterium]
MQIAIHAHGFSLTDALEKHVHSRLGFTFSRVSGRARRVHVRLSDLNGPRGGVDKRCLIEVCLDGLPAIVIQDVQPDMYTAIDRAAGRAARTVLRRLSLMNSRRRHQAMQLAHQPSPGL